MYSRKEKLEHFNQLSGAKYGAVDLELLADECPSHKNLTKFARDPQRYADDILYALLDVCTAEDIKENREYYEKMMVDADAQGVQMVASQSNVDTEENEAKSVIIGSSDTLTNKDGEENEDISIEPKDKEEMDDGSSKTLTSESTYEPSEGAADSGAPADSESSNKEPEAPACDAPPEEAKKK